MGASLSTSRLARTRDLPTRSGRGALLAWALVIALLATYVLWGADHMPWNDSTPAPASLTCPSGSDTVTIEEEVIFCDG